MVKKTSIRFESGVARSRTKEHEPGQKKKKANVHAESLRWQVDGPGATPFLSRDPLSCDAERTKQKRVDTAASCGMAGLWR